MYQTAKTKRAGLATVLATGVAWIAVSSVPAQGQDHSDHQHGPGGQLSLCTRNQYLSHDEDFDPWGTTSAQWV